jgi:predicted ribosomally synthesized peptide with nif11-like leader
VPISAKLHIWDAIEMLSKSVQAFNDRVADSPELQAKLRAITSPMDFLSLAKAEGLDLDGQDFQSMVQQAYQQWCETLDPKMSDFFRQVHNDKALDDKLKGCRSSNEVIALAQECCIQIFENELQQAALLAETIPGFSFEKLWFRGLGLLG